VSFPAYRSTAILRPSTSPLLAPAAAVSTRRSPRWMPVAGGVLGGLSMALAFPPYGWWPAAAIGVALVSLSCRGRSVRAGAAVGLAAGLAFFVPLLSWLSVVGVDAWLLLAGVQALFFAGLGAALAVAGRLVGWPAWTACLWVAQEALRDRIPFGGFPWGRLGFAAAGSPLAPYAALGGVPLVTAAVALVGGLLAALVVRRGRQQALALVGTALVATAAFAVPVPTAGTGAGGPAYATIALVQGNVPRSGLEAFARRAAVLDNHVAATERLAADARAGRVPAPTAVIWPENSSDLDPYTEPTAAAAISKAARAVGVPLLVGAVIDGPDRNHVRNTAIVWDPAAGPGERYVKRHPVPFGEYVPFRAQLGRLIGRFSLVPNDFAAGKRPGVLTVGPVRLADVICFEVAYDGVVADAVRSGGRVLVVQTNNATYGRTAQTHQQLAMARLRAIEHGRTVLVAATSGVSAVVAPDGSVRQQSAEFTAVNLVSRVALRDQITVADRVRSGPEWAFTLAGLAALGAAWAGRRRPRGSGW
jgi:apolipoprotein N-acyltransferase